MKISHPLFALYGIQYMKKLLSDEKKMSSASHNIAFHSFFFKSILCFVVLYAKGRNETLLLTSWRVVNLKILHRYLMTYIQHNIYVYSQLLCTKSQSKPSSTYYLYIHLGHGLMTICTPLNIMAARVKIKSSHYVITTSLLEYNKFIRYIFKSQRVVVITSEKESSGQLFFILFV